MRIILTISLLLLCYTQAFAQATDYPTTCGTEIRTVCLSSCDYTTIRSAVADAQPGWNIQVKTGIYTEGGNQIFIFTDGTSQNPICLKAYPNHSPVISLGYSSSTKRILLAAKWWWIDGFEITGSYNGIVIERRNNRISNNYIHNNYAQGIHIREAANPITTTSHILIENNEIDFNGTPDNGIPTACSDVGDNNPGPLHCHAIYIGLNGDCRGFDHITIRRNILSRSGGNGVLVRATQCDSGTAKWTDSLIENNLLHNNGLANLYIAGNIVTNNTIRNNTFIGTDYPSTNANEHTQLRISNALNSTNKFTNNVFYGTKLDYWPIKVYSPSTSSLFIMDYNLWDTVNQKYRWNNATQNGFDNTWKSVSGKDANSFVNVNPLFISSTNFHIQSISPAKNSGDNSTCASDDFDEEDIRPHSSQNTCDIGYDEF